MGMREVLLGKAGGRTLWQRMRDGWRKGKAAEEWKVQFGRAFNPLRLKPGDLVEIGFVDARTFEVETVLWFRTPEGDPDYVRYGMKDLERGDVGMRGPPRIPGRGEVRDVELIRGRGVVGEVGVDLVAVDVADDEQRRVAEAGGVDPQLAEGGGERLVLARTLVFPGKVIPHPHIREPPAPPEAPLPVSTW